jgi:hypothetical protein
LDKIYRFLDRSRLATNLGNLSRAVESCKRFAPNGTDWGYDFSGITFIAEPQRHMVPSIEPEKQSIRIELSLHLRGKCLPDDSDCDPLSELAVQIVLDSQTPDGAALRFAWHFDRQPDGEALPEEIHPRYHAQHAGRVIRESSHLKWGNGMFLDVPRLAFVPMDALLAIDLVLSSYLPTAWNRKCRADTYYKSIMRAAQRRYWRPYIGALSTAWNAGTVHVDVLSYWPQLYL